MIAQPDVRLADAAVRSHHQARQELRADQLDPLVDVSHAHVPDLVEVALDLVLHLVHPRQDDLELGADVVRRHVRVLAELDLLLLEVLDLSLDVFDHASAQHVDLGGQGGVVGRRHRGTRRGRGRRGRGD